MVFSLVQGGGNHNITERRHHLLLASPAQISLRVVAAHSQVTDLLQTSVFRSGFRSSFDQKSHVCRLEPLQRTSGSRRSLEPNRKFFKHESFFWGVGGILASLDPDPQSGSAIPFEPGSSPDPKNFIEVQRAFIQACANFSIRIIKQLWKSEIISGSADLI
jgi:hypothetical protein